MCPARYTILTSAETTENTQIMTSIKNTARILAAAVMLAAGQTLLSAQPQGQRPPFRFPVPEPAPVDAQKGFVNKHPGNPYLPLWEHLPDGEPRVFEDPDNPGHYRVYIIAVSYTHLTLPTKA